TVKITSRVRYSRRIVIAPLSRTYLFAFPSRFNITRPSRSTSTGPPVDAAEAQRGCADRARPPVAGSRESRVAPLRVGRSVLGEARFAPPGAASTRADLRPAAPYHQQIPRC